MKIENRKHLIPCLFQIKIPNSKLKKMEFGISFY